MWSLAFFDPQATHTHRHTTGTQLSHHICTPPRCSLPTKRHNENRKRKPDRKLTLKPTRARAKLSELRTLELSCEHRKLADADRLCSSEKACITCLSHVSAKLVVSATFESSLSRDRRYEGQRKPHSHNHSLDTRRTVSVFTVSSPE